MSVGTDSQSSSQILSSSHASLNQPSKRTSSDVSKIYKHASQLFLTRRLLEAYEALHPIVTPPGKGRPDDSPAQAPVATATTSQRVKIWSLYVTLLNSIVDLGYEEGGALFGHKGYQEIVRNVRNGTVWEQVVRDGYQGREGSVDAEVVYNLCGPLLLLVERTMLTLLDPIYSLDKLLIRSSTNRVSKPTFPPRNPILTSLPTSMMR
jgi:hypothetical protein